MPRPTRTTNRFHFTDLAPTRFEDLCLALIFPLHPWTEVRHYGRLGGDGGVDILAKERVEDAVDRVWFVQCRRYSSASRATLIRAVNDAVAKAGNPPDVLLVVLACDVSRKAHEDYVRYAATKGVGTPLLWTASFLEARLYSERRDLLFSYFGISQAQEARSRESSIARNIALKRRLRRDLQLDSKAIDFQKARRHPATKFRSSEVIIRSIDDTTYPDADVKPTGISGWFKLEIWDFYHNGLEFIVGIDRGIQDADGRWAVIGHDQPYDKDRFTEIRMFRLGRIPYRNIVDYDVDGDEYYQQPHLYCRFADGGAPYEGYRHVLISDNYPRSMEPASRIDIRRAASPRSTQPDKRGHGVDRRPRGTA